MRVKQRPWWREYVPIVRFVLIFGSFQALYYFLEWESHADREAKWAKFQADPEWIEKRAQTEADGAIVARVENMMLRPTNFSAVK